MCVPVLFLPSPPALLQESSVTLFVLPRSPRQVHDSTSSLNQTVDENLRVLEAQYAHLPDYLSIVHKLQGQLEELVRQGAEIPFWDNDDISLEEVAAKIELYDWYR